MHDLGLKEGLFSAPLRSVLTFRPEMRPFWACYIPGLDRLLGDIDQILECFMEQTRTVLWIYEIEEAMYLKGTLKVLGSALGQNNYIVIFFHHAGDIDHSRLINLREDFQFGILIYGTIWWFFFVLPFTPGLPKPFWSDKSVCHCYLL